MLIYLFVFIIVFIGTLIIIFIANQSVVSNVRKTQQNINSKVNNFLNNSNFQITKKFYLNDFATYNQLNIYKKFIAIDNDKKLICLINYEKGNIFLANFSEILNYELYENGSNVTTGGTIGGFWSGIFGAETNGMCKDLRLIIRLKRYDNSQVSYDIISNTTFNMGINKSSLAYKRCVTTLQEIISFLEVLKNENNSNYEKSTNINN